MFLDLADSMEFKRERMRQN